MNAFTSLHLLITVLVALLAMFLLAGQCRLLLVMKRVRKVAPSIEARTHTSLVVLTRYTLIVEISAVLLLLLTIPVVAFNSLSWQHVFTTTFGKSLILETLLLLGICILGLALSAMFHPHLKNELHKYRYVQKRYHHASMQTETQHKMSSLEQQLILREERLTATLRHITQLARWVLVIAIGVVLCVSLTTIFATLPTTPTKAAQSNTSNTPRTAMSPFVKTVTTTDNQYRVTLTVTPNRFGANTFTVRVVNATTDTLATNVHASLALTMLDMSMGTDILPLQADGRGQLSGKGSLSMAGNWQILISIRTPDAVLHVATVMLWTI
ncbi:MAG TPA: hypothetical protein DHW02_10960 [Ktedonobacter sp.]|nr:hypothetical protein [Ktedonobacter sp.]